MDRSAKFDALYRAHAPAVLAYALRRSDRSIADDVLGDVFLVMWRRIEEVPSSPRPWLFGVARRVLANYRRSQSRRTALTEVLQQEGEAVADLPVSLGVWEALDQLKEIDREALLLTNWDGLSATEAAAALDLRLGTFTMRQSRARQRLARILEAGDLTPKSCNAQNSIPRSTDA